jgi:hypothetical protein
LALEEREAFALLTKAKAFYKGFRRYENLCSEEYGHPARTGQKKITDLHLLF